MSSYQEEILNNKNNMLFKKHYSNFKLFIICPKKDIKFFKRHTKSKDCEKNEESNILKSFYNNKYFIKSNIIEKFN